MQMAMDNICILVCSMDFDVKGDLNEVKKKVMKFCHQVHTAKICLSYIFAQLANDIMRLHRNEFVWDQWQCLYSMLQRGRILRIARGQNQSKHLWSIVNTRGSMDLFAKFYPISGIQLQQVLVFNWHRELSIFVSLSHVLDSDPVEGYMYPLPFPRP